MFGHIMLGHSDSGVGQGRLSATEYLQMAAAGAFDEHVELLRGEVVLKSPTGPGHVWSVAMFTRVLVRQLGDDWLVQPQSVLTLWDDSMPEPDLAVVPMGTGEDHADSCVLAVEVADTSLRKDSTVKAGLYAEAAIPVYWLVDLKRREVLVYSEPHDGVYRRIDRRAAGDVLTLAGHAAVAVPVAEIFPAD